MSRYKIGIDLGTTNSVVFYIDGEEKDAAPKLFAVPQVTNLGEVEDRPTLPSFLFIPDEKDVPKKALALPWQKDAQRAVGELAKKNAAAMPNKTISSAKSWLCAENVDRTAPVLPWDRNRPEKQLSPVDASRYILEHVRDAWNHVMAADNESDRMENQTVILTVPASFDAVARELTVKAASAAGLASVILLEEPQAAFYAWLRTVGEAWRDRVSPGDVILVCDIGGGTTDFSLIRVSDNAGNLELERVAVGRHLLLGGDNMDLTAAYHAAAKIQSSGGNALDAYQISAMTHACREAKESLLSKNGEERRELTALGGGSSLIGGSVSVEITRDELSAVILDGFFPVCELSDKPKEATAHGLRSFGLRYESDPAITRHLAGFLVRHCLKPETPDDRSALPNKVLFNGGVTKSAKIVERLLSVLSGWLPQDAPSPTQLMETDPDLAVAKGAARYAEVREGKGVRVKAGSSHAYYVGVESSMPAVPGFTPPLRGLCVLPLGAEEGSSHEIPYSGLGLLVGETTEFRFFASTTRAEDQPGTLIENADKNPDLEETPKLTAELPALSDIPPGCLVPITLRADLTETGTLQIWCEAVGRDNRWKLEFELRDERYFGRATGDRDQRPR